MDANHEPSKADLVPLKRCAHNTHALATIATLGLWAIVWAVAATRVREHNRRQEHLMVAHRETVIAASRLQWQAQDLGAEAQLLAA